MDACTPDDPRRRENHDLIQPAAKHGPTRTGGQVREFLDRAVKALDGLAECFAATIVEEGREPASKYCPLVVALALPERQVKYTWSSLMKTISLQ